MRNRNLVLVVAAGALAAVLLLGGAVLAQPVPVPPPYNPGDTMPASMFYWLIGVAGTLLAGMATALKVLWNKLSAPPEPTPCPIQEAEKNWATERVELRTEISRWQDRYFRQQTKMEKLAVRVQRAVEALADLESPEVESDLDDVDQG